MIDGGEILRELDPFEVEFLHQLAKPGRIKAIEFELDQRGSVDASRRGCVIHEGPRGIMTADLIAVGRLITKAAIEGDPRVFIFEEVLVSFAIVADQEERLSTIEEGEIEEL